MISEMNTVLLLVMMMKVMMPMTMMIFSGRQGQGARSLLRAALTRTTQAEEHRVGSKTLIAG